MGWCTKSYEASFRANRNFYGLKTVNVNQLCFQAFFAGKIDHPLGCISGISRSGKVVYGELIVHRQCI